MKSFLALASFVVAFSMFFGAAAAQDISVYSVDADLSRDGRAVVKMVVTFEQPVGDFEILLPFKIADFNAVSSAGPADCQASLDDVSAITCRLNLTEERKTLEMNFTSTDLVKATKGKYIFTGDFTVKVPAKNVFAAVRLPEGMVLTSGLPGGATVPFSNSTSTDGRKITVIWRFTEVSQKPLSFQVFFEPGIDPATNLTPPSWSVVALLGIIFGGGIALVFLRRRKKTHEVVFSVLDDYEKRVISSIEKAGGTINQKKIVLDTNLSKAKVSRVVQKLAERGLVHIDRQGRTNIVKFLKKNMGS